MVFTSLLIGILLGGNGRSKVKRMSGKIFPGLVVSRLFMCPPPPACHEGIRFKKPRCTAAATEYFFGGRPAHDLTGARQKKYKFFFGGMFLKFRCCSRVIIYGSVRDLSRFFSSKQQGKICEALKCFEREKIYRNIPKRTS